MKIMINQSIYDSEKQPIIIKFSESDLKNIKKMPGMIYAAFPDHLSKNQINKIKLEMDAIDKMESER